MQEKAGLEPISRLAVGYAAQELTRKAYKVLDKTALFHDNYVNVCATPEHQKNAAHSEPVSENTLG